MATTGNSRTAQVSTSSFKPLSLQEIMAVPLALQAKEDKAIMALDEFSSLEANSLDADRDYVSGQIGAFRDEAGSISDEILSGGVNSGLVHKVRSLRNKKNAELSINGKTGQASAAYNQYQANKKSVMARKDLSAQQKELGLQQANSNYEGVVAGGQYEDYTGTASVDIMQKGRDILKYMTPEEKAGALGMTYSDGMYRDGTYARKTLTPEHIQKVVYQALSSDRNVTDYTNELEQLGIVGNGDLEIQRAAQSAGNVGQVNSLKNTSKVIGGVPGGIDASLGMVDKGQAWDSMPISSGDGLWDKKYDMISGKKAESLFSFPEFAGSEMGSQSGYLPKGPAEFDQVREDEIKAGRQKIMDQKIPEDTPFYEILSLKRGKANRLMAYDLQNRNHDAESSSLANIRATLGELRTNFPALAGVNPETKQNYTDREVFDIYQRGKKRTMASFSQVVKPSNPSSTFIAIGEALIGSGTRNGSFTKKNMMTEGGKSGGIDEIAKEFGFESDDEMKIFKEAIRTTGSVMGFSPGHVDMPGAFAVQIELPDGSTPLIYMQNDDKAVEAFSSVASMNQSVIDANPYKHSRSINGKGELVNQHVITELSPLSGTYEAAIIRSKTKYTSDELANLTFARSRKDPSTQVAVDANGKALVPTVFRHNYDDEIQRTTKKVTRYYDSIADKKQGFTDAQKN